MKAIIPLAGKGTRLRPHTLTTPKPLLKVGGKPVMSYILDDLIELGVEEVIFVVGYLREVIQEYIADHYPNLAARYVVQEVQDGTAGAIKLAEPFVDEDILIVFVDTLFDADLSLVRTLPDDRAGVIWAKEVDDYQRFGVIVTDDEGAMTRIVEKPTEPVSRLANIGLYYIRDWRLLFEGIDRVLEGTLGPGGEYYLTDAFQYMVDQGSRLQTAPVGGWYDCGKLDTLLETNRHLLETSRGGVSASATVEESQVGEAIRIEDGVRVVRSTLGPNVTLEDGAVVEDSVLRNCIVGEGTVVRGCRLRDSVIGAASELEGLEGRASLGKHSAVTGETTGR